MSQINKTLEKLFENDISGNIIKLFLVLYASLAAPKIPKFIRLMFDNALFKIIMLALIVYQSNKDLSLALMISISFTLTLNYFNMEKTIVKTMEKFASDDTKKDERCKNAEKVFADHKVDLDNFKRILSDNPRGDPVRAISKQIFSDDMKKTSLFISDLQRTGMDPIECGFMIEPE
jgi:hypothetical protein